MTDDKDALEELRRIRGEMGPLAGHRSIEWIRSLDAIIAAWEKERASLDTEMDHCTQFQMQLTALRAAVEKVMDELREASEADDGMVSVLTTLRLADALDAALRGGA